ncbi:hypothetical protein [Crocosphaera sp.]|uniref:hypothetical protein n=1 Tax=Crocosphaera sp. TaxID=2729996 RepID=UPI002619D8D9|nr:hypothetical protein [Crocosphaera sp.]MDJ0579536.1 hypothetical protein [Crocosphaera sp.]
MENNQIDLINNELEKWSQGDFVLGEHLFVHRFNPQCPLTSDSKNLSDPESLEEDEEIDLVESEVRGLVIITQTCDIVRRCHDRPFLEVAPLVETKAEKININDVKKAKIPQYAYIEGVADQNLVADLDRVMTVEKALILQWDRQQGCVTDEQKRLLRQAIARKRIRVAFPNDFVKLARKFQERMKDKHKKRSDEGKALRALREIRISARPSWNDDNLELMFYFIREEEQDDFNGTQWYEWQQKWLKLLPESGRFQSIEGLVISLEDMTAKEYIESDQLDLDHLSMS